MFLCMASGTVSFRVLGNPFITPKTVRPDNLSVVCVVVHSSDRGHYISSSARSTSDCPDTYRQKRGFGDALILVYQ